MNLQTLFTTILILAIIELVLDALKKTPLWFVGQSLAAYRRFWKETSHLHRILYKKPDNERFARWKDINYLHRIIYAKLNNERFARWEPKTTRYIALKAIKAQSANQEIPQSVLDLLESALNRGESVLLNGEPGAGKTTALEALTYRLAQRAYRYSIFLWFVLLIVATFFLFLSPILSVFWLSSFFLWESLVKRYSLPLFLEARFDYQGGDVKEWREKKFKDCFGDKPLFGSYDRVALFVDGVNEIPSLHGVFVEGWRVLLETQKQLRVIFTSRAGENPSPSWKITNTWTVCDLDDSGVREFLKVYGREKAKAMHKSYSDEQADSDLEELQNRNLLGERGIGRNPYWLHLMVDKGLYTRNRGKLFYEFAIELIKRETKEKPETRHRKPDWNIVPLDVELNALGSLALAMHFDREIGFSDADGWNKARKAIRDSIGDVRYSVDDILGEAEAATLIRTELGTRVEFVHQLVQEFFAAYAIWSKGKWKNELFRARDEWWWQTLFLLGGLQSANDIHDYTEMVESIMSQGPSDQDYFVAIGLLQSAENIPTDLSNSVTQQFISWVQYPLTPSQQRTTEELVRTLGDQAIEVFGSLLRNPRYHIRKKGVALLCAVQTKRAVEILAAEIRDESRQNSIISILEEIGEPAVNFLIAALHSDDGSVMNSAQEALSHIGKPAVGSLVAALKDDNKDVRWQVASILGKIGDERAIVPLLNALQDTDYLVRMEATGALRNIGQPAIKPLIATLRDADKNWREDVVRALAWIKDERILESLIACLQDTNSGVRQTAIYGLGEIRNRKALKPLMAALGDEDLLVVEGAANALGKIGDPVAVEPLSVLLLNPSRGGRDNAAIALGQIGDVRGVEPLIKALQDRDVGVRMCAAEALGKIGDARAAAPLTMLLFDEDLNVHNNAVDALAKIGGPAVEPLITFLSDSNADVRVRAARELGKIGSVQAVQPLIATLSDSIAEVRAQATMSLGRIGDPRALPELERLIQKGRVYELVLQLALKLISRNEMLSAPFGMPPKTRIEWIEFSLRSKVWQVAGAARKAAEQIRQSMKNG